ncbi:MAG TPA: hypothetical protein VLJ37_05215 [bacterium]|nr:hypothetical protein [bacterium]
MFGTRGYRIGVIAGSLALAAFLGTASAQTTRDVTAGKSIKVRDAYTYTFRPVDKGFGIRDYTFFPGADNISFITNTYKMQDYTIRNFFRERLEYDAINKSYKEFRNQFEEADNIEELKLSTYITSFFQPNQFLAFADAIDRNFTAAARDADYTFTVDRGSVDKFFNNYFTSNVNWNVTAAYSAFIKEFNYKEEDFTMATFKEFFFVPGMLRFFGISYMTNVSAVAVPTKD